MQKKFLKISSILFLMLSVLLQGCNRSSTSVGLGVGIVVPLSPETRREMALSTWYTGSSLTSSTTVDKQQFISEMRLDLIRKRSGKIAEESAQGKGKHIEALATLLGDSTQNCPEFLLRLHQGYRGMFYEQDFSANQLLTRFQAMHCSKK